jgi:putative type II/III system pilus formation protein
MRLFVLAALFAAPAPAMAWPVNAHFDLKVGEEKFQRLTPDAWVEVETPAVATAEVFETAEVMLTGKSAGSTLVLVHAEDKVMVWRVVVREGPDSATAGDLVAPARKACREVKVEGGELTATIRDEACRQALLKLFQSERDPFLAKDLDLTFELGALQSQLKAIESAVTKVAPDVKAVYVGAGLRLTGRATAAQHRRVFWEVFKGSVGRLALEDRIEESAEGKAP